jgi:hypothetical protein
MYLTAYHFEGERAALLEAYERMLAALPPAGLTFHVCAHRDGGITVLDGCPSEEVARAFRTSPEFGATLAACGLPEPRVEPIGEVHRSIVDAPVGR